MLKFSEKESLGVEEAPSDAARDQGVNLSGEKRIGKVGSDKLVDRTTAEALDLVKEQGVSQTIIDEAKASLETGDKANLSPQTVAMLNNLGIEGLKSSDAVTKILGADAKGFDAFSAADAAKEIFGSGEDEVHD